jgi:NhaA family Na+:H+ antiporter
MDKSSKPMKEIAGQANAVVVNAMREFLRLESVGGILLLAAAVAALVCANSPLADWYVTLFATKVVIQVGALSLDKPLLLWINDGLMAIFFFLIGLEIKREVLEGELSSPAQVALPGIGALGGMIVPALIYFWINLGDQSALDGWAIPVATDIAFALGLLSAFGKRVPTALKVFLLTLAIFDDLAAIVIIALFYSGNLSLAALLVAAGALTLAVGMNRLGVSRIAVYVFIAVVLWVAVLKSGVHATLAGVLIAFCIPIRDAHGYSPARALEHDLHAPVAYAILPIFAFANAGLALGGLGAQDLAHPVTLGVIAGLLIGKPIGVIVFVALAIFLRVARLPKDVSWMQLIGISFACGIGFTMSLFIAGLAFERGADYAGSDRLGVLVGSIASAVVAFAILQFALPRRHAPGS